KQNNISKYAGLVNPYLAIRHLSMGMAGSDFSHYIHFLKSAEQYRYNQSQKLNHIQATQLKYGDKESRLSSDTWKAFSPFTYDTPGAVWAIQNHVISAVALLLWLILICTAGMK